MGFLNPANLLWALSLGLLVLIYLRSRSRPTIDVSSLMLFDEEPAPVASVRHVRIDALFWFELTALAALVLAIAGLYAMLPARVTHGRNHALVFDVGAGMTARAAGASSIDRARKDAMEIIAAAPSEDEFSVITYALDTNLASPPTSDRRALRHAIAALAAQDVPARSSALAAALIRARGASDITLFTDRDPPREALGDIAIVGRLHVRQISAGGDNLSIVSLDPGSPGASAGRAVIRNFSIHPQLCELAIDLAGAVVFHRTLMLAPREQVVVPFGPLKAGGILHAQIQTADAIAADNERWAFAPSIAPARVLVLSHDPEVGSDLARVLMAVNPNFQVETADPAKFTPDDSSSAGAAKKFALVAMFDCYVPGFAADATMLAFPPMPLPPSARIPGLVFHGTIAAASMVGDHTDPSEGGAAMLGATRVIALPDWMKAVAYAERPSDASEIPIAAIGTVPGGRIGIIAFDLHDHLLLDPDRLDALVATVNLVKRLTAPADAQIVATGSYVDVPVGASAHLVRPDGSSVALTPDKWRRVRVRPTMAGRYTIESSAPDTTIYANYYDAAESDLGHAVRANATAKPQMPSRALPATAPRQVTPLTVMLVALAMLAFLAESAILLRRAPRWRMRHV